jgi:hypothetical protein
MAVFVVRDPLGRIVSRHLRAVCPRLVEAAEREGLTPLDFRVPNTKTNGYGDESTRCDLCFFDRGPLPLSPREFPRWVLGAEQHAAQPGTGFVGEVEVHLEGELRAAERARRARRRAEGWEVTTDV